MSARATRSHATPRPPGTASSRTGSSGFSTPRLRSGFFRKTSAASSRPAAPSSAASSTRRAIMLEQNTAPFIHRGQLATTTSEFPDTHFESLTNFARTPRRSGAPPQSTAAFGPKSHRSLREGSAKRIPKLGLSTAPAPSSSLPQLPRLGSSVHVRAPRKSLQDIEGIRPDEKTPDDVIFSTFHDELRVFEDTLGAELAKKLVNGSAPESQPAQSNRDYHLLKVLFRMTLLDNSGATKLIHEIGENEIVFRLEVMKERYGARRMNKDEFHVQLIELLETNVSKLDSDILFDMFDNNLSGFVDEAEFMSGMRMTLHDKNRTVAAHCRRLLESRMASGTVVSMMEAELMLRAVADVCKDRYPGIDTDVESLLSVLHPQSHHSQIPLLFFRTSVMKTKVLAKALADLTLDAALPPIPTPPPSPDPQLDIPAVCGDRNEHLLRALPLSHTTKTKTPTTRPSSRAESVASNGPSGEGKEGYHMAIDMQHKRFRADKFLRQGQDSEGHPPEKNNPHYFCRNGVVWYASDLHGPMAVS